MRNTIAIAVLICLAICGGALLWAGSAELHAAARADKLDAIAKELDAGTDIEAKTDSGYTALALAAYYGKIKAIGYLLSRGANIETRQQNGYTPFFLACWRGFIPAAKILAEAGADIEARSDKGYTALIMETGTESRMETLEYLIDVGARLDAADDLGYSALMWASRYGRADIVARLLGAGADPAQRDKKERDAWWWAAYGGSLETVDILRRAAGAPELPRPSTAFEASASGYSEGLHIHVFWFQLAEGKKTGMLSRHAFPVGIPYPSQRIVSVHSLTPYQTVDAIDGHHGQAAYAIRLKAPIEVTGPRPLLIGIAADVGIFEGLNWKYQGPKIHLPAVYPVEIRPYLRSSDRYDIQSPRIQKEKARFLADNPDSFELARRIWSLVYESVSYDSVPWPNSGSQILEWGKGRCGDFTRAFISLARACGIPSRGVWGLGEYTWLSDGDHAWAEIYIDGIGWLPVQAQIKPKDGFAFPVSFNEFYLLTRYSEETDTPEWPRPSQMFGRSLSKGEAPNGVGVFIRLPESERGPYRTLASKVIADSPGSAAEALSATQAMRGDARVFMLWLICASSDVEAGTRAAAALVSEAGLRGGIDGASPIGDSREEAKQKLSHMMKESPDYIRERIAAAIEAYGTPPIVLRASRGYF